jgi:hypothetical protein
LLAARQALRTLPIARAQDLKPSSRHPHAPSEGAAPVARADGGTSSPGMRGPRGTTLALLGTAEPTHLAALSAIWCPRARVKHKKAASSRAAPRRSFRHPQVVLRAFSQPREVLPQCGIAFADRSAAPTSSWHHAAGRSRSSSPPTGRVLLVQGPRREVNCRHCCPLRCLRNSLICRQKMSRDRDSRPLVSAMRSTALGPPSRSGACVGHRG